MARCSTCTRRLHASRRGPDAERMSDIWRTKQLEYSWTLTLAGHYAEFWTLTERALDYRAGARALGRQGAQAETARRLFQARRLSRRTRGLACAQGQGPQDRDSVQRLARDAQGRGRRRRRGRRARRRAVGRRSQDVQAAAGGLRPCHAALRLHAQGCDFRIIESLGRDGRRCRSVSAGCGSIAAKCRTNMPTSRRNAW